ncbi:methyltransferase-like 26 isoform X2 [Amphibalanus amphitrite]|uniref:methyltransferase-like 26 isoform X2 n=1 Tax=Amphibalanus amphitrite TaxID=1232801 RepID=UPI001C903376|nr:methyltransferase-like 26 isoform X2 [Amphibalanus amphitrite]
MMKENCKRTAFGELFTARHNSISVFTEAHLTIMLNYPAAQRNTAPILEALLQHVSRTATGVALEVSSGSGQHVAALARQYPSLQWQPTELESRLLDSIGQHTAGLPNVRPARLLDAAGDWATQLPDMEAHSLSLVVNINMVHIAPWRCALGLMAGAGRLLRSGALLITYGPYAKDGLLTPQSNVEFDAHLRAKNAEFGVRDIRELEKAAAPHGLRLHAEIDMPANNKTLVWKKD